MLGTYPKRKYGVKELPLPSDILRPIGIYPYVAPENVLFTHLFGKKVPSPLFTFELNFGQNSTIEIFSWDRICRMPPYRTFLPCVYDVHPKRLARVNEAKVGLNIKPINLGLPYDFLSAAHYLRQVLSNKHRRIF